MKSRPSTANPPHRRTA